MPRWDDDRDDEDEDEDEDEDDYGDDPWSEESDEPTVPCRYCREPIPEDAPRCPYCERYISAEDAPAERKPAWLYAMLALSFVAVVFWVMR